MLSIYGILRVVPVISSSMLMQANYDQQTFFRAFLHKDVPFAARGKVLPRWYRAVFIANVSQLGVLYMLGFAASLTLYLSQDDQEPSLSGVADHYHLLCATFTAAHAAFSPWAWENLQGFSDIAAAPESTGAAMKTWLAISLVRICVADMPAWLCAILALSRSIKA